MGYNAGGFGSMTFPSDAALGGWRAATVSHAAHRRWLGDLAATRDPDETVAERLARVAKRDDPGRYQIQEVEFAGRTVTFTYDGGEDDFRDGAGDLAALLRSAAPLGAKGTFWFLGTAGAEQAFCYELALDGKASKLRKLPKKETAAVYGGKAYAAYRARVDARVAASDSALARWLAREREGVAPAAAGGPIHERAVSAFAGAADAELAAAASAYPHSVPDGATGSVPAKKVFGDPRTVRSKLTSAASEEHRAVALWVATRVAKASAVDLALAALAPSAAAPPVRGAALASLAGWPAARTAEIVDAACRAIAEATLHTEIAGAVHALGMVKDESAVTAKVGVLLRVVAKSQKASRFGGSSRVEGLLRVIEKNGWRSLSAAVSALSTSRADPVTRHRASQLVLAWGEPAALETLARQITDANAALAWIRTRPDAAFARAEALSQRPELEATEQRELHFLLEAVDHEGLTKKADRILHQDPRWVGLARALMRRSDRFVHSGSRLLAQAPRDPALVAELEAELVRGTPHAHHVYWALKGQGVPVEELARLVKERLAVATDGHERNALMMCKRL